MREEGRDRTPATPWQKQARHAPLCSAQLLGMKVKGLGANGSCSPRPPVLPLRGGRGPQLVFGVVSPGGARSQLVLSPAWAQLRGQRVERLREWRRPSRALELWASGSEVVPMMWQQKQDTEVPEQN